MKTDDFTGFVVLTDGDDALELSGDYDPSKSANWETDLFLAAWEDL